MLTLHIVSCGLGGSSACKNKTKWSPTPRAHAAFCVVDFVLKNRVVELVSRHFLQSACHDNYVPVMTRLTFFILLDLYET
jgi:hypothetical protein